MKATALNKRALNTKRREVWLVDDGKQRGKQIFSSLRSQWKVTGGSDRMPCHRGPAGEEPKRWGRGGKKPKRQGFDAD